jgi:uncharacterized protein (DUF885 family)
MLLLGLFAAARVEEFHALVDRAIAEAYFAFDPAQATAAGFHEYDARLGDGSRREVEARTAALRKFETALAAFDARSLPPAEAADRELLLAKIRGALLTLERIRPWEKDPDTYSSGLTAAIFVVMSREFAPPEERLKSVIARERMAPRIFESARANLRNPPRISTEIALEQLPGMLTFFRDDVPAAFTKVTDAKLRAEFRASNQGVIEALQSYQRWLRDELLARSSGDFRIGAENYRLKLLHEEMVDTPLDRLLAAGMEDLRANQREFARVAARIDARRTPREILKEMESDYPAPGKLLETFRSVLGGMREFIERRGIVDIPSPVPPIVRETPPFMRALTFASMDTPGPFEKVAKEAFFNVTLPEAGWPAGRVSEHMAAFNRGVIVSTALHEAYPGHYVQFLWVQRAPSKVRKLFGADSNSEGWAHYAEQMMLDEGYGGGDPKLRLGQLQDALLRNARFIVGIRMHTGDMSFDKAVDFFVEEGYQTRANAEREAKRGTSDPTYLVYTLGKLEILKLREEYRKRKGAAFSLREFHNAFLAEGFPPLKLVRRAMLR